MVRLCVRRVFHGPAFAFPRYRGGVTPNKTPGSRLKLRDHPEHAQETPGSQLKTNLEFQTGGFDHRRSSKRRRQPLLNYNLVASMKRDPMSAGRRPHAVGASQSNGELE